MSFAFDIPRAIEMVTTALLEELGDEVDLIFRYGSLLKGNTHRYSDLDISYVPARDTTWTSITVLVNEIMIDLYPIQWASLERMARFEDANCTILDDSAIVYQRNTAVGERFEGLGAELRRRQQPEAREEMLGRAQTLFQSTGYSYFLLREAAARGEVAAALQQAQNILRALLHCLAVANQAAIDTRKLEQVLTLPLRPPGLERAVERIMTTAVPGELLQETEALMTAVRALLLAEQRRLRNPPRPLAELLHAAYPELKGDIQHLILACEREDPFNFNLVQLLHELQIHMAWATDGVAYSGFNSLAEYERDLGALGFPALLPAFAARDYAALAEQARRFDERLRQFLGENEVALHDFGSLDELQEYLDGRVERTGEERTA